MGTGRPRSVIGLCGLPIPSAFCNGIVGVQTFCVNDPQVESIDSWNAFKSGVQASSRIFAEHQILAVGQGEGLLVGAFNRGLNRSAERHFCIIDDRDQRKRIAVIVQTQPQMCGAALAVGRRNDAVCRAKPIQYVIEIE